MFKNLTIKSRLIFVIALLSVLLIVIGAVGLFGMSKANDGLYSVYNDRTKPLEQLTQIDRLILHNRLLIAVSIVTPTAEEIRRNTAEIEKNIEEIGAIWKAYIESGLGAEEKAMAEKFADNRAQFVKEGLRVAVATLRANDLKATQRVVTEKVRPLYVPVGEGVNALIKLQIDEAGKEYKTSQSRYDAIRLVSIVAILAGVGLAAFIGIVLIRAITVPLHAAVVVTERIANGHLDNRIEATSNDEVGRLMHALKNMNGQLASLVGEVRNGTQSINTAAVEITTGNSDLSQRTQEQASALEETASSMEEMTSTVKHNADNARQANQLAANARKLAEDGTEVVTSTIGAMDAISDSSKKIADIIGVINEIAFQTNLLALNAAVEAARAGEQGRGFAVVATEVRNLAQRSAQAAKEIKELIVDSVDKVKTGSELVDKSGTTLSEIVTAVKKVSDIIAEIAAASQEQSAGIDQVNKAVMQMDEVTQQNAALVEETAAASKSMEEQAKALLELVSRFRTDSSAPVSISEKVAKALPASGAATVLPIARAAARKKQTPAAESPKEAAKESPTPAPKPRPAKTGTEDGEWEEF